MVSGSNEQLIQAICDENLAVYRASVPRLREDVGQEAEIAHDYRGRIVYELLQNADDAMAGAPSHQDAVSIRLTQTDLWVGNSGRPLDEDDVRGLCGIGASSKGQAIGRRRASIGHKGMGFKSVLEITDAPEVFSETFAFRLGRDLARGSIEELLEELGEPPPERVPAMRFPQTVSEPPAEWEHARADKRRTLFRFPLRSNIEGTRHRQLADRLLKLPVTAIVFLKHLEQIDVEVDTAGRKARIRWEITRERRTEDGWAKVPALGEPGIYRITVGSAEVDERQFLVAHDNNLEIGEHRSGLDDYAWRGIELAEVAVAAELVENRPTALAPESRVLHVFLPTGEQCPYELLINGAFSADLSRQEIRVSEDPSDYNRWLLERAAHLFGNALIPALEELGAADSEILMLLDRGVTEPGEPAATGTARALHAAMRDALSRVPAVSLNSGERVPTSTCVVPPLVDDDAAGANFRELLQEETLFDGEALPQASVCGGRSAFVLVDHGARALTPSEAPGVLADADLSHVRLGEHESGGVEVDPVLTVLESLWSGLPAETRSDFESAVRAAPLLPSDSNEAGEIERVAVGDQDCFYPPRALTGSIPLEGLCFITRDVCWGALLPKERQEILRSQMAAWQAMFGVRDFKFPDVMRSSVLPALTLPEEGGRAEEWERLQTLETLASVCQLSGRTPNPSSPLPYERLGTNRALFNLSRLPVPCLTGTPGTYDWEPAYRVYFSDEWIEDASIEHVLDAISATTGGQPPEVPMLAPPEVLVPLLEQYQHLRGAGEELEDESDDEVGIDEDEEQALDTTDRDRWVSFLTWLGVNRAVRPVHFADVEDRNAGWLTTKDLSKPRGWAFRDLPDDLWNGFTAQAETQLAARDLDQGTPYFYAVHDLEYIAVLLEEARKDVECNVGRALFVHLTENWAQLQRFTSAEVAVVAEGVVPSRRKTKRAQDHERHQVGENLWLLRIRQRDFCPTKEQGPKAPANIWTRTAELERRFSSNRGGVDCSRLLPVLDVPADVARRAQPLLGSLGVREEITASSFRSQDAATILQRLKGLYPDGPDPTGIREVVRPTYRSLIELLPGQEDSDRYEPGVLSDAPLLVSNGHGKVHFRPASEVLWAERNGTRERLGNPPDLWTFVYEASTSARLPLTKLLGVRVLEDQLEWTPVADDALDDEELEGFREGLWKLAPYFLARLSADRSTAALQRRDASTIKRLIACLLPVGQLVVGCQLEGVALAGGSERAAFVELGRDAGGTQAFVKWGGEGWPPSLEEAEALATAFAEGLGATYFEAFLALISAPNDETRSRMLSLAGAPTDLETARQILGEETATPGQPEKPPVDIPPEEGREVDEDPARPPEPGLPPAPEPVTPLYGPDDLLIDGEPVALPGTGGGGGDTETKTKKRRSSRNKTGNGGGRYGGRTNLGALDRLGMFIAMTHERNRLRGSDRPEAEIFDPELEEDQPNAFVFDVSSPELIDRAKDHSPRFAKALTYLTSPPNSVDPQYPGCDILTIGVDQNAPVDRLIELKSSGVQARTQAMTWNEWKTAQSDELRSHFYLYLAGNLRSDLPGAAPFLRTVHDPYETMRSEKQEEHTRTRKVVLYVSEFDQAEELKLGLRTSTGTEP